MNIAITLWRLLGEGLTSFGSTSYGLNSSGNPMTSGQSEPAGSSSSSAAGNGY